MTRQTWNQLEELVEEYHHVQAEHRRTSPEGSARRHLRARLDELEERFERLLRHEVDGEPERERWRARLHHGAPAPPPPPERPPVLFRGRAETGSTVELRRGAAGEVLVEVDGALVERIDSEVDGDVFLLGDREFVETFDAPPAALEALRAWASDPSGPLPHEHVAALVEDGLLDEQLALTARGRRLLRHR